MAGSTAAVEDNITGARRASRVNNALVCYNYRRAYRIGTLGTLVAAYVCRYKGSDDSPVVTAGEDVGSCMSCSHSAADTVWVEGLGASAARCAPLLPGIECGGLVFGIAHPLHPHPLRVPHPDIDPCESYKSTFLERLPAHPHLILKTYFSNEMSKNWFSG